MNLDLYAKRIQHNNDSSQKRQIENKQKTLKNAIKTSYFRANVVNLFKDKKFTANIYESDKNNDNKIISCFVQDSEVDIGSVLFWEETNTYWMITDQDLNELAYFEGTLEKCQDYQIETIKGKVRTWGVVKVNPSWSDKKFDKTLVRHNSSTLELKIPNVNKNIEYFKEGELFTIKNSTWSILTVDNLSDDNIIIITALKHANDVDGYLEKKMEEKISVNDNTYIDGPNEIYPLDTNIYRITNPEIEGFWSVPDNKFITKNINNDNELIITWNNARKRENFTITYGKYSKEIVVSSLV